MNHDHQQVGRQTACPLPATVMSLQGPTPKAKGGAAPEDNAEARRAALRDKLAQRMKQDLLQQEGGL